MPSAGTTTDRMAKGKLLGLGVGPGDPELITLKALRLLRAAPVVAYFEGKGKRSNALTTVMPHLLPAQQRMPLIYPVTGRRPPPPFDYEGIMARFYDEAASMVAAELRVGNDVAAICEGDPFFYGSFMYLHDRLADRFETDVVPGVCSVLASASALGMPLVYRDQTMKIVSGTLPEAELRATLRGTEAAAIMKLGSNFAKVRGVIQQLGLLGRAHYVERATTAAQRVRPLAEIEPATVPYFAMILIPGERWQGQ
jgi:precorrin-2/cobalt-factor-2 C20-methyltransferase